ncbi:MAG: ATP-binding protein, partial [Nitrospirae bacterium]|nr:ATP-binding protein [Nitrospirota bacterium]
LKVSDFDVPEAELSVLDILLKSKEKYNILIYGTPGTGKTSFVGSLAKKYIKTLLTVKIPDENTNLERISYLNAVITISDNNSIILVDEADEILNSSDSGLFRGQVNKSWINGFLDNHKKKIIWIANRVSNIDPSTMRRFSFTMEFKSFNDNKRLKVIKSSLSKNGFNNYFSEEELKAICKDYSVNAGGIVDAIKVLKINKRTKKESALNMLKTLLKNHEKAINGKVSNCNNSNRTGNYSLDGLNTSHKLDDIINILKRYANKREDKVLDHRSITMLLHGMPGTGKSEFVYHLGNLLEREVSLKRCSEITSKWVGETEKNIAEAFEEASEEDRILFFDEADSFLYPRHIAEHSWEKTATNELLTQIESFRGIVIFATNDLKGLDHAALRRFKFKIEFLPLKPESNLHFYNLLLSPLININNKSELTANEINQIKSIRNLTPGDFNVVKEQYIFIDSSEITHKMLIDALINETKYKTSNQKRIGFAFDE